MEWRVTEPLTDQMERLREPAFQSVTEPLLEIHDDTSKVVKIHNS